ncbi:dienelactone hydrolase family protein [Virgisporangium aurantiacum]|uniref:Carboxymethylenebutenolidase n=1 Tax=Virgisporangium aurantiacum TaxID=175570 RepID=A0A8J4DY36_9ACTN|nr:dienelactone hydrolase family protein [Virgisporangium aurantiacum]GIJ54504.1 carboxymethylenebutenolidase [Virgisporangium aurantiacum]
MTEHAEYLTSEVVVDYADGLIDRREALRRLSLLGVGAAVATPMLAACDSEKESGAPAPAPSTSPSGSAPAGPAPLTTEAVTFAGPEGRTLQGAWAAAADPRGTVLVIHENRGLTDHIRSVAGRFAASGYSALAIDLLSAEGGTAKFTDPAQATAALNAAPPARFMADLKAGVGELQRRVAGKKTAAIGFCFGGGMVWSLLASGEPRLAAAAPFYGPFPSGGDLAGSKGAAVLGVYAGLDDRVNATRDTARAALEKAGNPHEIVTYDGANHAFFNDTGQRYDATAAAAVYQKVLDWFGRYSAV